MLSSDQGEGASFAKYTTSIYQRIGNPWNAQTCMSPGPCYEMISRSAWRILGREKRIREGPEQINDALARSFISPENSPPLTLLVKGIKCANFLFLRPEFRAGRLESMALRKLAAWDDIWSDIFFG
ncbi:hypothetical protein CEXT_636391 [Caerostris extrusa]|uniref:Uncharacterized protein n=1 Tax=Caerostris extrusa TaxID=172846 RepID=A0AAV4WS24_CAEEX|nr:hypothetical protein CEXT_636391 [Caerostris extrusa]